MSTGQKEQAMTLGQILKSELLHEAVSTRKMLERIPAEKMTWKPHEKSMALGRIAGHIVEMFGWTNPVLTQDEIDFANPYAPKVYNNAAELVADFDKNIAEAAELLGSVSNETMGESWALRNGEHVIVELPKAAIMRTLVMNHIIHHRGQMAVYLRLLDIPVPSVYGPSADEQTM
jgi:uncharacterized damage-inducible protein DinB